jgi:hypothetical protein
MLNIILYGIPDSLKKAILCEDGTKEKARIFMGIQYADPSIIEGIIDVFILLHMRCGVR